MTLNRRDLQYEEGRKLEFFLPEVADDVAKGIPLGPPSLEELELPKEIEIQLHNELFHRGILTGRDALRNRNQLIAAVQSALKVDAERVLQAYVGKDYKNGTQESAKEQ